MIPIWLGKVGRDLTVPFKALMLVLSILLIPTIVRGPFTPVIQSRIGALPMLKRKVPRTPAAVSGANGTLSGLNPGPFTLILI